MAIREIITPANPVLRQKSKKVTAYTAALKTLADDMVETMRVAPGVGLAAPQVAVGLRMIVVEYAEEPEEAPEGEGAEPAKDDTPVEPPKPKLYKVVNPELAKVSEEMVLGEEGCLSLIGFTGLVERHQAVTVKGFNLQGKPVKIKAEGWLARIFQHEIDHLDGILFIDRATKVWKQEPEPRKKVPEAGDA
jgi:peptide deformylase